MSSSSAPPMAASSPSPSPDPLAPRVLQSIRDSFGSTHRHHQHHHAHHPSAHPFVHSQSLHLEAREASRHHSQPQQQQQLHASHSFSQTRSHSHSHSSQPRSRPRSQRDSLSQTGSLSLSLLHLDEDPADGLTGLTRSPSSSSSSAPTQSTSPVVGPAAMPDSMPDSIVEEPTSTAPFRWHVLPPSATAKAPEFESYVFQPSALPYASNPSSQLLGMARVAGEPLMPSAPGGWEIAEEGTVDEPPASGALGRSTSGAGSSSYCSICLDIGADAFLLPCQHSYHARCILAWVESDHQQPQHRLSCPMCRSSIEQFVPLNGAPIEDEKGDLLARFLAVWEKHYYQAPQTQEQRDARAPPGGNDDGDQLLKPTATQEYPQRMSVSTLSEEDAATAPVTPTSSPMLDGMSGDVEHLESLEPLTAEQRAWQQLVQDVFFIPDTLPDDFIIPSAHTYGEQMQQAPLADWSDHAANIAAVDGGISRAPTPSALSMLGWFHNPFGLLASLYSAFSGRVRAATAHLPLPTSSSSFAVRRSHSTPNIAELRRARHAHPSRTQSEQAQQLFEATIPEEVEGGAESPVAAARTTSYASPASSSGHHLLAGASAGGVNAIVSHLSHTGGRLAFVPSPMAASMPAIAAYFTSYELMKAELGLTPGLNEDSSEMDPAQDGSSVDPRGALVTPGHTARYFAAASGAGALHNVVKIALTPGVLSLASAFASTAQISARMGIQFSVFEQAKNAFALYRHKRTGEELSPAEILVAASLGGVVAASVMYPLQHLLPQQHWLMTAPPPGSAPGGIGSVGKPTLLACLGRFLPACVATAVTYEFAFRAIRGRTQAAPSNSHQYQHHSGGTPLFPHAVHSHSSSSLPGPSPSPGNLVDRITTRTTSLLSSIGVHPPRDEIVGHIPIPAHQHAHAHGGHSHAHGSPHGSRLQSYHSQPHPLHHTGEGSRSALQSVRHLPADLARDLIHTAAASPARVDSARFRSTLGVPGDSGSVASSLVRSRSHPALVSLASRRHAAPSPPPRGGPMPPLDPW